MEVQFKIDDVVVFHDKSTGAYHHGVVKGIWHKEKEYTLTFYDGYGWTHVCTPEEYVLDIKKFKLVPAQ